MPLFSKFWKKGDSYESSGDECVDESAGDLSYVGTAVYNVLRRKHNHHHHELWNVTKGKVIGDLQFTPRDAFTRTDHSDPLPGHDDWFPKKIGDLLRRTEVWCDVMSLAPPDGAFMVEFKEALKDICEQKESDSTLGSRAITIRMMFGNIVGMPVNCNTLIKELTKDLPADAKYKIKLWVGSWRKDVSWNHAKIVAVDGKYLWTGGHNFWDPHYLRTKPVNDLSLEMEGGVARDAHRFANAQWGYIVKKQSTSWGRFVDKNLPDALDVPRRARVTVSEFPRSKAAEFPPFYKEKKKIVRRGVAIEGYDPDYIPVITMGRYGKLLKNHIRPSDDGIAAMLGSAQTIIRLALQDLGPVALPGTKNALPGMSWPHVYIEALARVIWERGVDVEIVLSNPGSIPGDLSPLEACYGNGWSCVDVAAEIIKAIKKLYPNTSDGKLRHRVQDNLRVCFLRSQQGTRYKDGQTLGLHSKHFIVDDICCYIGSQNLYICDLAEWGVVIDDRKEVTSIKAQYWDPMWKVSYVQDDCEVDKVMDGLKINREAVSKFEMTRVQLQQAKQKMRAAENVPVHSKFHAQKQDGDDSSNEEESDSDGE